MSNLNNKTNKKIGLTFNHILFDLVKTKEKNQQLIEGNKKLIDSSKLLIQSLLEKNKQLVKENNILKLKLLKSGKI